MALVSCVYPACTYSVHHPRLLCVHHWRELPLEIRAKVTRHLMAGNPDSARIALGDWFSRDKT